MKFDAKKAANTPLVAIGGPEESLRRRALAEILVAANSGPDDYDYESFNADEQSPSHWLGSVSSVPFMGEKRTLVVRHLLRVDPKEVNVDFAALPETARLILVADEESASTEDKVRKFSANWTAWQKKVTAANGVVIQASSEGEPVASLLIKEASKHGKKLSESSAEMMQEMVGGNLSRALAELEKLIFYVGDADEITSQDVRKVVSPSREWSIWNLIGAAGDGRIREALSELRNLIESGQKADQAAHRSILPLLSRHLRLLLQARIVIERGGRPGQVSPAIAEILPEKHIGQEKPFSLRAITPQAQRVTIAQCLDALDRLALADAQLKGAAPAYDARETLETLILDISSILGSQRSAVAGRNR